MSEERQQIFKEIAEWAQENGGEITRVGWDRINGYWRDGTHQELLVKHQPPGFREKRGEIYVRIDELGDETNRKETIQERLPKDFEFDGDTLIIQGERDRVHEFTPDGG